MHTMLLWVLLLLGVEPWRDGLDTVPVRIEAETPWPGALGLACDRRFEAVPGNAQHLCPEEYQGIIIYGRALRDLPLLLNVLHHEDDHIRRGPQAEGDPFGEAEAYRNACLYSYVPECEQWGTWR